MHVCCMYICVHVYSCVCVYIHINMSEYYSCVHLYTCVCIYMYVCTGTRVYAYGDQRSTPGIVSQEPSTHFWDKVSPAFGWPIRLHQQASEAQGSSCLWAGATISNMHHQAHLLCLCWDLTSGLHACMVDRDTPPPPPPLTETFFKAVSSGLAFWKIPTHHTIAAFPSGLGIHFNSVPPWGQREQPQAAVSVMIQN